MLGSSRVQVVVLACVLLAGVGWAGEAMFPTPRDPVGVFVVGPEWQDVNVARFGFLEVLAGGSSLSQSQSDRYASLVSALLTGQTSTDREKADPHGYCVANLKNISTALEMYSTEHPGYPARLAELSPSYLKTVPRCPLHDTEYGYQVEHEKYTVVCRGKHPGEPDGQPNITQDFQVRSAATSAPVPPFEPPLKIARIEVLAAVVAKDGQHATVPTRESLLLDGKPLTLEVTYEVVKQGQNWLVDTDRTAPDLDGELKAIGPNGWPAFIRRNVPRLGAGKVALSFVRYVRSKKS